jgi:proteic killer suppression protein
MVIHFRNNKLRKTFSSEKELIRTYGADQAKVLKRRISELKAARFLEDLRHLPQLHPHELAGNRNGQISITVRQPYRLIMLPANDPIPTLPDGGLDWAAVTEVTVIEFVDYH